MFKHFVVTLLILSAHVSASAQSTAKPKPLSRQPLKLTVRTDKRVYRRTEEMTMETQLLNAGTEDVYVWEWDFCWNPARGLSMYITSKDGPPVGSSFLLDCVPPPAQQGNVYQFIKIRPQEFHGTLDTFKIKDFINKPGEYDIEVTFNSFISGRYVQKFLASDPIAKLPLWTMEEPTITASPVHIVVNP